jgi:tetratricopeptide (TPR) repeat protein
LIETAGESGPAGLRALRAVRSNKKWLGRYTQTWGAVAYALMSHDRYRECARWMRDYKSRQEVGAWMLHNHATALHWIGRDSEAIEVARHALTCAPDHTRLSHALWVALADALAGKQEEARALLSEARDKALSVRQENLRALTSLALWATSPKRRAHAPYRDVLAVRARLMEADKRAGGRIELAPAHARARRRVQHVIAAGRPLLQRLWIRWGW